MIGLREAWAILLGGRRGWRAVAHVVGSSLFGLAGFTLILFILVIGPER